MTKLAIAIVLAALILGGSILAADFHSTSSGWSFRSSNSSGSTCDTLPYVACENGGYGSPFDLGG